MTSATTHAIDPLAAFLRDLDDRRRAPATISAYTADLRDLSPTPIGLRRYVARLAGFKPATVARKIAAARSFCAWLGEAAPAGWRAILVGSGMPKALPIALDDDALARLLAAPTGATPLGLRDRALLRVLVETGCRVSEAVQLDVGHVLPDRSVVLAAGTRAEREAPISAEAMAALGAYVVSGRPSLARRAATPTPALFLNGSMCRPGRMTRQGIHLVVRGHAAALGLGDVTPALLRHTAAYRLAAFASDPRDAQHLLGHMSVATTLAYRRVVPARRAVA